MNKYQEVWWRQAESDHDVLVRLRQEGVHPCHQLHDLQMVTEKLGKAYFWRTGSPPPMSHAGFVQFLRSLGSAPSSQRERIAEAFSFVRFNDFQKWVRLALPTAYALERLAPALVQPNGPNPEYPWPQAAPEYAPATFEFDVWKELTNTGRGRLLLKAIEAAVKEFPRYA